MLPVAGLLAAKPDLADALERLSSSRPRSTAAESAQMSKERLGLWGLRVLPPLGSRLEPTRELALLRIPSRSSTAEADVRRLGRHPSVLVSLFNGFGLSIQFQIPAVASLALAAVMFFIPNYNALDDAEGPGRVRPALGAYST